jgi:flagellar basal-body rod modification protein FlgD
MPINIAAITAGSLAYPVADTPSASGTGGTGATDTIKSSADATDAFGLSKDDFFKLFLSQLKNQDPTAPMDDKEFLAQLAQFTMIDTLQQVKTSLGGTQLAQASALIGDQVIGTDTSGIPAAGTVDRIVQDSSGILLVLEGGAIVDPASVTQVVKTSGTGTTTTGTTGSSTATT